MFTHPDIQRGLAKQRQEELLTQAAGHRQVGLARRMRRSARLGATPPDDAQSSGCTE